MKKLKINFQIKILLLLVAATFLMGIGYATINGIALNVFGTATAELDGDVKITNVSNSEASNISENTPAQIINDGKGVSFDLNVTVTQDNYNEDFHITYLITVTNDSVYEQKILKTAFVPNFTGDGEPPTATYHITDINGNPMLNDTIPAKTSESYYFTITLHPSQIGTWGVDGETNIDAGEVDTGTVVGSISGSSQGDLSGGNTLAHFTASVINSHSSQKTFTLSIDSSKFEIVDQSGNALSDMSINANDTNTYDFYIRKKAGAKFMVSPQSLNVHLTSDGETSSMGVISLIVDVDSSITDTNAPIISDVTATTIATNKTIHVSWNGTDENTITNYYVQTYTSNASGNGSLYNTTTVPGTDNSVDITVPTDDAYYYFYVYGIDQSNNTATTAEISSCSTDSGHCSRSVNKKHKWNFKVVLTLTNAKATGGGGSSSTSGDTTTVTFNVFYDNNVSTTLSGSGKNYDTPESISSATITYPGDSSASTLPSGTSNQTAYSYTSNSGALNIYHVTGDINISASGKSCLAKGTKITLADGTYKNVEDIGYDDLLMVWNYDTGNITYEYPLWIENEHETKRVTRVTFSDDSYIDFVGNHAIYNTDINLFVNINDEDNFHVGTNVAKRNSNNKLENVQVKNIEKINRDTTYYFVGTTTYYNLFANDILTTDHNLMISNLYGFTNNAKWPKEKEIFTNNENNLFDYDDIKDVLPYYLYDGFRVKELSFLIKNNMVTLDEFKNYISSSITNPYMIKKPINKNGHNYWMVTTDLDDVSNKYDYLKEESSTYILPTYNNVSGWLNTSDNKIYNPGDEIKVTHGLHFISIKKGTK